MFCGGNGQRNIPLAACAATVLQGEAVRCSVDSAQSDYADAMSSTRQPCASGSRAYGHRLAGSRWTHPKAVEDIVATEAIWAEAN
jgi:hypothetical protein